MSLGQDAVSLTLQVYAGLRPRAVQLLHFLWHRLELTPGAEQPLRLVCLTSSPGQSKPVRRARGWLVKSRLLWLQGEEGAEPRPGSDRGSSSVWLRVMFPSCSSFCHPEKWRDLESCMNDPQGPRLQGNLEEFASTRLCMMAGSWSQLNPAPSPTAQTTSLYPRGEKRK